MRIVVKQKFVFFSRYIDEIEKVFNVGLLSQSLGTGIIICMVGYKMLIVSLHSVCVCQVVITVISYKLCIMNNQTSRFAQAGLFSTEFIAMIFILSYVMSELYFFCYYGNEITLKVKRFIDY